MKIEKININCIGISGFTSALQHIPTPPEQLYIRGALPESRRPTVAIVGSRKPTAYGAEVTHRLAYDLAKAGVVVVSGLAFGIDSIAHKAALEAGGITIAVLPGGLHAIYPAAHRGLAQDILQNGGALVSEHEPGVEARKYHFLARNRLVSGLADALIVTEATERSGTLSTVAHALEQNKDIFAVPGPITSLLSAGPNRLLQQGAYPTITARDVLEVIAPQLLQTSKNNAQQTILPLGNTASETIIIELIQSGVCDGDAIQRDSRLETADYLRSLTMLELNGVIRHIGANQWVII